MPPAEADTFPTPVGGLGPAALTDWFDSALNGLGWHENFPAPPSRHVQRALDYVDEHVEGMPRLVEASLARASGGPSKMWCSVTDPAAGASGPVPAHRATGAVATSWLARARARKDGAACAVGE